LLGDFRTLVVFAQDWGRDDARAAAKQSTCLSGFAIGASHPPNTLALRTSGCGSIGFARLGHAVAEIPFFANGLAD
jgi:hypothetical protein